MTASPYVLLDDSLTPGGRSLLYTEPEEIISASAPDEVNVALDAVSAGLARGLHAAGFFSRPSLSMTRTPAAGSRRMAPPIAPRFPTSGCLGRASSTATHSTRSRTTSLPVTS